MKKFLRYIFTIALFAGMCFCGYKYITDWGKPEEINIAELSEQIELEEDNLLNTYHSKYDDKSNDQVMEIEDCVTQLFRDAEKAGVEYLITDSPSSDTWDVYAISEEEMNTFIKTLNAEIDWSGSGLEGQNTKITDVEKTKKYIELLLNGFEQNYSAYADGISYAGLYSEQRVYPALGRSIYDPNANGGNQGLLYKSLKDDGLLLDIKNVDVKAIYINRAKTLAVHTEYALVEVEMQCIENFGVYSNLSWVPGVGQTDKVKFIISYNSIIVPKFESKKDIELYDIAYFE